MPELRGARRLAMQGARVCGVLPGAAVHCGQIYNEPAQPSAEPPDAIRGAVDVAVGLIHACATRDDGSIWCWPMEPRNGARRITRVL
jgi:hypothetical protein